MKLNLGDLSERMAAAVADGTIPRREFRVPDLPPGVLPSGEKPAIACDSAISLNGWLNGQTGFCGLGFPGYTYLSELAQRSEYRAPSETTAEEMTRCWIELTGATEKEKKDLELAIEEFQVEAQVYNMIVTDGEFGRSQISINIKGQMTDQRRKLPLIVEEDNRAATIPKGSLLGFKNIEPIWTTPSVYNSIDPTQDDFYVPELWYVLGKPTHNSRLLTYISHPLPDVLKPSYNFSGISQSQLIEPYVIRWLKNVDSGSRMLNNYSTSGFRTNLMGTLADEGTEQGTMSLFKRAQMFNQMKDNRGLMVLDKDSEEFFQFNTPLSGVAELVAQSQEHMAAPTKLPLVKLTGITPSGLNASSEGEIKVLYDHIGARQKGVTPIVRTMLRVLQCHLWGKVNPKIGFRWVPLDTPTDKEESEMRKADGDRDSAYVTNGIVSPEEVRERLRTDQNSGYAFITGDAPAPPLEQEHELGEKSADNQAQRDEQSAQAAHKRQKELDAKKKLAKDAIPEFGFPVAKIIVRKRDSRGRIPEPDHQLTAEEEKFETHVRQSAINEAYYSDPKADGSRPRGFDPVARYVCGGCNKAIGENGAIKGRCTKVIGGIRLDIGSCEFWEDPSAGDPECDNPMYTKEEAGYAEQPNGMQPDGTVWGCLNCDHDSRARFADTQGRGDWCDKHGMHVLWNACCVKNEAKKS